MGLKGITIFVMVMTNKLLGFSVWAEEFVLCSRSPARTIKCDGPGEVIDVQAAQLLFAEDTSHCTDPNIDIIGRIKSRAGISCEEELAFTNCHGKRECSVDHNVLGITFTSCRKGEPNTFYVRYFCHSFEEDKAIQMNNHHKEIRGQIIDLISPSFPCNMTEQTEPYTLTCTVSPEGKRQNEWVKIYVQYKFIRFAPSNCVEKIYLQREGHYNRPENVQCSKISNAKDVRNKVITGEINGYLNITYQNAGNRPASAFWIQVEVKKKGQPIDVTVSCSHATAVLVQDRACIPISLSNDTVVDMTTITTAITTEASSTFPEVTIEQFVTNTAPTTMLQESKENEDSKVMLVVLGALLGLSCMAAFAVLSIIYLIRKRKKNKKDSEMVEQTQSAQSGPSTAIYSVAASIDECKANGDVKVQLSGNEEEEVKYDNAESTNTGDVYAKVDKSKKTAKDTDETNADETLMVENDDLYDMGKNPECEPEDEYNSENDDEHIYDIPNRSNDQNLITNNNNNVLKNEGNEQSDQTAVTEGNETNKDDAKEKDQIEDTTTDPNNRSFEKAPMHQDDETDNDSVVMYENSEIYSSSVDLNEEGEEAEETLSDADDETMSENTAENPQKKMSYTGDSDIGKENEL